MPGVIAPQTRPAQQIWPPAQLPPEPTQVEACAGVGATIEATTGTATAAAMPSTRTISRRFQPATSFGGTGGGIRRLRPARLRAKPTTFSSTRDLSFLPRER